MSNGQSLVNNRLIKQHTSGSPSGDATPPLDDQVHSCTPRTGLAVAPLRATCTLIRSVPGCCIARLLGRRST